ncbi:hypothetical protein [Burkholderia sp. ABCPW 111]|uniref:hypothetical protein n=1 Tax=Burkholderia sp. ABCPW 111 TaxID=1820025 RepID=UPI000530EE8E|nr:hypothetical protein [Burkholderia sp. ABCPW 111]KGR93869.1 hypothetical protein X946_5549 [Burkholderia sp. ABCPW 111]
MTNEEISALTRSLMRETARLHAEQVAMREGGFFQRLRGNPLTWAAGFFVLVLLAAKFVLPWAAK